MQLAALCSGKALIAVSAALGMERASRQLIPTGGARCAGHSTGHRMFIARTAHSGSTEYHLSEPRRAVFNARLFTYSVMLLVGLILAAQIVRILGGDGEEASVVDVTSTTEPTADSSPTTGSTTVAAEQLVPSSAAA